MPPTFTANDALLETRIAQSALTQLNLMAMYPRVCVTNYEPGAFEVGNDVKIRRPKRRRATELNPRSAAGTFNEAAFFSGTVTLEKLWFDGWQTYGIDPRQTIETYLAETGSQMADAIATPNDEYMNSLFTTWSATTGAVALGANAPIGLAACVDSTTGQLTNFNSSGLTGAGVVLDKENVPKADRYALISPVAGGAFLSDSIAVTGFAAAGIGGGQLIQEGMRNFVPRFGFAVGTSNVIASQNAIADLDTSSGTQPSLAIASAAASTSFTYADNATTTYVGAVNLTLTCATALSTSVAVGQIARLGTSGNAKAFGVILRLDKTTPTAPVVTLVPFAPNGTKLTAADIVPGTDLFSIPSIPSINTVNHREGILMATRRIAEPSPGSGAVAASITDTNTNLTIQVFRGNYDTGTVSEKNAYYMLTGSKISDFRKCALILSL
ncbi:MAG: hypothetical protein ACOVOV_16395 [Dolichospermum sp.]|jgi:hypothetical protein